MTDETTAYSPPKIWTWDEPNGGRFANVNRPVAGSTHEKVLPVGRHPLQLYSMATPNGVKVTVMLEELLARGHTRAEYDAWLINILEGDQFGSGFVSVNPNSKIPALMDRSGPIPIRIFESGAILIHLAEKFGEFLPTESDARAQCLSWLLWQVGSAPYLGGGFGHFYAYAPTKIKYAIDRFTMEVKRQLDVLDRRLSESEYVAGPEYTIADMAIFGWYGYFASGEAFAAGDFLQVAEYKNVQRWTAKIGARPAVKRGRMVNRIFGDPANQLHERHEASDFEGNSMIYDNRQFYIDGAWVDPVEARELQVINPATENLAGIISMGGKPDVERAVAAARRAFDAYSRSTPEERLALLERVLAAYQAHYDEIALAIYTEMGAPITLAKGLQTRIGVDHISAMIEVLRTFPFEEPRGTTRLVQEPVGVCALITPWNWPMNQVAAKVVPALAAGCTMVLKPSEYSPFSAILWAKVMHEAGVPAGVFNLINGDGSNVGAPLTTHREVDMVSFTGSTRAGTEVAKNAAASVKRVHQELGGKSPNLLLHDADFERAVKASVLHVFQNSGQSCNAPTRMLVPAATMQQVEAIAKRVAETVVVGDPTSALTTIGPVVSKLQFDRVEGYIEKGIAEGATVVTGGTGRPSGLTRGYFVRPTIFSNVHNDMTIAREEIFGPVLCILPYQSEEQAVKIANDTLYGLAAYVWSQDNVRARRIGNRIRAGQVTLNGASGDMNTPFGGFKMSGNGREWGEFGLRDFLEVKAVIGVDAA